jgi:hypothetical protein
MPYLEACWNADVTLLLVDGSDDMYIIQNALKPFKYRGLLFTTNWVPFVLAKTQ